MSAANDPFPMRSEEAARLAASVKKSDIGEENWNNMSTRTGENTPSAAAIEASKLDEKDQGLMGTSKKSNVDDDSDDEEEHLDFLDRPMNNRGGASFLEKLIHRLYGPAFPVEDFLQILTLAMTLFFSHRRLLDSSKFKRYCYYGHLWY